MKSFRNFVANFFGLPLIDFFVGLGLLFINSSNKYLYRELSNIADILNVELTQKYTLLARSVIVLSALYLITSSIFKSVKYVKDIKGKQHV